MNFWFTKHAPLWTVLLSAVLSGLKASPARGEDGALGGYRWKSCPAATPPVPECPRPLEPVPALKVPPETQPPQIVVEPTLPPERFAALGGETVALAESSVGYIDSAIPFSHFRLRVDAAYRDNRPDRAEFFYGKCGCFKIAGTDPQAPGPPLQETRVDYQDISSYLELALSKSFSGFVEIPVRFLNPEVNANASGLADINAGLKWAILLNHDQAMTLQFRAYAPTGDAFKGLGTNHVSLEPAFLVFQRLTDRLNLEGEFRDWVPVGGTDFAGNVIRYGAGLSYRILDNGNLWIAPVAEVVGWTVLNGKEFAVPPGVILDATGDTIVNAKMGLRIGAGNADFYAGYGRALTGDVWYKDIVRLEFRLGF